MACVVEHGRHRDRLAWHEAAGVLHLSEFNDRSAHCNVEIFSPRVVTIGGGEANRDNGVVGHALSHCESKLVGHCRSSINCQRSEATSVVCKGNVFIVAAQSHRGVCRCGFYADVFDGDAHELRFVGRHDGRSVAVDG